MMRSLIVLFAGIFLFLGCAGKEGVKESHDAFSSKEALGIIKSVEKAYKDKNRLILKEQIESPLLEDVLDSSFDEVTLSITPWIVRIKGELTIVNVDWHGTWIVEEEEFQQRGIADFIMKGNPLKVVKIDGDNPFIVNFAEAKASEEHDEEQPLSSEEAAEAEPPPKVNRIVDKDDLMIKKIHRVETEKPIAPILDSKYYVQIGAWSNLENANRALMKLKKFYPEAVMVTEDRLLKVRIIDIEDKEKGAMILSDIEEKLRIKPFMSKMKSR